MNSDRQNAFTLIEVLITLVIVLILVGVFIGGGSYLKVRAERQLTQSAIEVIVTALEQYYDEYKAFPFSNRDNNNDNLPDIYTKLHLELDITGNAGTVSPAGLTLEEKGGNSLLVSYASSAAMYYFLDQNKDCRQIIESLVPRLITNKDTQTGLALTILVGTETKDLPRFIDVWGMSLRYEYMSGYSFPVITSAGPDKIFSYPGPDNIFGTADDIESADNLSSR